MAQGVPGRLRPRIFLTFRHYKGGRLSAKTTGRLYPRRNPWYSLSEAEWTSGHMVLSGTPQKKSSVTPPGIDPGTVRLVAQRFNHYATSRPDVSSTWRIVKGKGHTRTCHEGPEGEQRYSSTPSLTSALDEDGRSMPRPGRVTPGKDPVPIVKDAGWAPWRKISPQRNLIPGPSSL